MITVIAGGVGAARFLRGLVEVVPAADVTAIINTADDFDIHGLYVCPDLDTVRSTLADDAGPEGWGRAQETWNVMNELAVVSKAAPDGSRATDWFSLGDRDLAIHLYRTQRLKEGASLDEVTAELADITGLRSRLVPMTNDQVRTQLQLASGEVVDFQEYFVARQHQDAVTSIDYRGAVMAKALPQAVAAIENAELIIIAPSNPLLSIGPVMAIADISNAIRKRRDCTVAISPIVNGRAIKGPALDLLAQLGYLPSCVGVAQMWHDFASQLLIDDSDAGLASGIEALGMQPVITNTVMANLDDSQALARIAMGRP